VLAAAQVGWHNEKRESFGHSLIVDPWGKVLGDAGKKSNFLITVDIGEIYLCSQCSLIMFGSFNLRYRF